MFGKLLAMLRNARRNTFGDPKYHSGRKKKEFASLHLEFLDKLEKAARKMPQTYEFDPGHADGIRHADLDAGVRVLNEVIYECQRSLEGIEHARLDLEARSWARGAVLRERMWGVSCSNARLSRPGPAHTLGRARAAP
jgi:hypothetical protein